MSTDDENMRGEFESLKEILGEKVKAMEANNKAAHAENETAIERLRTDIEKSINTVTIRVMGAIGLLGVFIAVLQYFNR